MFIHRHNFCKYFVRKNKHIVITQWCLILGCNVYDVHDETKSALGTFPSLTHWHISASMNCVIIGSGNGLSPVQRQAITCTNAALLWIGTLGTHFSEIRIKIQSFSLMKRLSPKGRPCCPVGDELITMICFGLYYIWDQLIHYDPVTP